ncbi:MAG: hypothetical protein ACPF9D_04630 [Owenweeksia sp.]
MKKTYLILFIGVLLQSCSLNKGNWYENEFAKVQDLDANYQLVVNRIDDELFSVKYYENAKLDCEIWLTERRRLNLVVQSASNTSKTVITYYDRGKIKYMASIDDSDLEGDVWYFSETGKLNAVYLFRNDQLSEVLYTAKDSYSNVDASFKPILVFPKEEN